jgi:ABC-type branched-subunit amino acid transport system ATPase component
MTETILSIENLTKKFGGLIAVNQCSFKVGQGSITGLIGPNGAGKTTLFNLVCGSLKPTTGEVFLQGKKITGFPPHRLARLGVGRTFQLSRVFKGMTVWENLYLVPPPADRSSRSLNRAKDLLQAVGLENMTHAYAGALSYGQQKLLEFARTFMLSPELVLLDEIFAGLNPEETERQIQTIRAFRDETQTTFVVIDHAVGVVLRLCEWIVVMNQGEIIAQGPSREIETDEKVIEAYFGSSSLESLMKENG